jgi:hypothetical protein
MGGWHGMAARRFATVERMAGGWVSVVGVDGVVSFGWTDVHSMAARAYSDDWTHVVPQVMVTRKVYAG